MKIAPTTKISCLLKTSLVAVSFQLSYSWCVYDFFILEREEEEEHTDDEQDEGWITKKRNFFISKNHSSAVLYINRTFTLQSPSVAPENKVGKIVDVVVPADNKDYLHFKYYDPVANRREKNFKYISCRDLLEDKVNWDVRDITGRALIKRRVQTLFEVDGVNYWYEGRVEAYDSSNKKYTIRYCDNQSTQLDIKHLLPDLRRGDPIF